MTIKLFDHEQGAKFHGDYDDALEALEQRLERLQVAHIVHKRRSIIMFEGWDAAGKGGIIKRLTSTWDPRWFQVWPIGAPTAEEKDRHFLWRFWNKLPASGEIGVFDRSWYGRVLVERVEGYCSEAEWQRGYDEINEFESGQVDAGTNLVKLFVHVTQEFQDEQLAQRLDDPWKRWKTGADDYRNRNKRADYLDAMHDMFKRTDTRWAPWQAIDGNNRKAARIAALTHICDTLEEKVPMAMPDRDPAVVEMAREAFGYEVKE